MKDELSPIYPNTKGVVVGIGEDPWSKSAMYYVRWENGRTLNLIADEDIWFKNDEKENLTESVSKNINPCDTFSEGKEFCNRLSNILNRGVGGAGSKTLKKKMIQFFTELLQGDYTGVGNKIVLEPGNEEFVIRYEELINLHALLDEYGACSKMRKAIENDLEVVSTKGLKMVVDDDENYSVLNRIDTHYTFRAYILTLAALDVYQDTINNKTLDELSGAEIISFIDRIVLSQKISSDVFSFDTAALQYIDSLIQDTLADEQEREKLISNLNATRSSGNEVENEVARLLASKDYQVHNFGQDFGFVDKFGIDMVVVKDGRLHPVQISSKRKNQPVFFNYADSDCECWAIYPTGKNKFRREVVLESKEGLINVLTDNNIDPSRLEDLLSQLPDEEVTDLSVRNLERKFLKSGDPEQNARKYLNKLVKSIQSREQTPEEDDDYSVEDELVYGGEEPEVSSIGRKQFKKELLPLQVELLKLQEHIKETGKAIAVVFEGRDTAGKGSTIGTITKYLDPKFYNMVALGIATPEERKDWFGRYEKYIEPGKITFFDRSWYNRGIVEPVMGYSSEEEYEEFMNTVNDFEQSLVDRGVDLYKFWLSITPKTQEKRFNLRKSSPLKYWKFSPNDEKSLEKWDDYTEYKEKVFQHTKESVPWTVVDTNDKRVGSLNLLRHILKNSDYKGKDESTIGDTYPESITTINENFIDDIQSVMPILNADKDKSIFKFLVALRDSGITNMMAAPDFTWGGEDFLRRYLQIQELQGSYQVIEDKDEEEELIGLARDSQRNMIQAAFNYLRDKGEDASIENINRALRLLGSIAFKYYTLKL